MSKGRGIISSSRCFLTNAPTGIHKEDQSGIPRELLLLLNSAGWKRGITSAAEKLPGPLSLSPL
jgi:hypothetical protein